MLDKDILEGEPGGNTPAELLALVRAQAALLTDVATGGREIKSVEVQYVERRRRLRRGLPRFGGIGQGTLLVTRPDAPT